MASARTIYEEAAIVENGHFDEQSDAVTPAAAFSPAQARVTGYEERGQRIVVNVETSGPALLVVNQTYFTAWRANNGNLATVPVNIDRLGVIVPGGRTGVILTFGRNRFAVAAAWIVSTLALLLIAGAELVQKLHGRTGEVERAGDDDRAAR